jgi:ketosteroid isomerase-like protein
MEISQIKKDVFYYSDDSIFYFGSGYLQNLSKLISEQILHQSIHDPDKKVIREPRTTEVEYITKKYFMKKGALLFFFIQPFLLMAQSEKNVTENLLQSFADAFNRHDIETIMKHMTDDCVFEASAGPDYDGQRFVGQEQVRRAFLEVFEIYPDAKWNNARHVVSGDRGFSEWIFTGTKKDGTKTEVTGCDLFTFVSGKIAIKNSYRKNRLLPK